ncbi:hypothetical protein H0O00_00705 [Candidatus Micrarchaeota archaeon]|nr:hypothetical protein [Candidatus Micrarchaeota archaeon]
MIKDEKFRGAVLEDYRNAMKGDRSYIIAEQPKILSGENVYQATYWADLGIYYTKNNKWNEAASCLEKSEKLGLTTYWVNAELGAAYSKIGRENEAITRLEDALMVRPSSSFYPYLADAHIGLAQKYKAEERFDDARKELDKIIANPEMKFAYGAAKHLLARIDHIEGLKLLETEPERGIAVLTASVAAYRSAFTYYQEGNPNFEILKTGFANAYHNLVGAYVNTGRIEEAKKTLAAAIIEAKEKHLPIEELSGVEKEIERLK